MPNENKDGATKRHQPKKRNHPSSLYVRSILTLYTELPHTPARSRPDDRFVVRRLEKQKHPLLRVQAALLLGTARRIFRSDDSDPLMPIRSVRFFLPIIDELRFAHVDQGYVSYLARKLADFLGKDLPLTGHDVIPETRQAKRRRPRQLELPW